MIHRKESISLLDYPLFTIVNLEIASENNLDLPSDACVVHKGEGNIFNNSFFLQNNLRNQMITLIFVTNQLHIL